MIAIFKTSRLAQKDFGNDSGIQTVSADTINFTCLYTDLNELKYTAPNILGIIDESKKEFFDVYTSEISEIKRVAQGYLATIKVVFLNRITYTSIKQQTYSPGADVTADLLACTYAFVSGLEVKYSWKGIYYQACTQSTGNTIAKFEKIGLGVSTDPFAWTLETFPSGRNLIPMVGGNLSAFPMEFTFTATDIIKTASGQKAIYITK